MRPEDRGTAGERATAVERHGRTDTGESPDTGGTATLQTAFDADDGGWYVVWPRPETLVTLARTVAARRRHPALRALVTPETLRRIDGQFPACARLGDRPADWFRLRVARPSAGGDFGGGDGDSDCDGGGVDCGGSDDDSYGDDGDGDDGNYGDCDGDCDDGDATDREHTPSRTAALVGPETVVVDARLPWGRSWGWRRDPAAATRLRAAAATAWDAAATHTPAWPSVSSLRRRAREWIGPAAATLLARGVTVTDHPGRPDAVDPVRLGLVAGAAATAPAADVSAWLASERVASRATVAETRARLVSEGVLVGDGHDEGATADSEDAHGNDARHPVRLRLTDRYRTVYENDGATGLLAVTVF